MPSNGNGATVRTARGVRNILAAFITAVGFAFLVIAVNALRPDWFEAPWRIYSPFFSLTCFGLGVIAWFCAVNPPAALRAPGEHHALLRPSRVLLGLAALSVVLGCVGLYAMCARTNATAPYDQYALSLAPPDGDPKVQRSVLFWWVKRDQSAVPAGALPMFLGSLLAVGFGVWFPKIGLASSSGALGAAEKYVAPLLSLALVGIGANQQSDAVRANMDKILIQEGRPAGVRQNVDASTTNAVFDQRRYAMDASQMSDAALAQLQQRVTDLGLRIDGLPQGDEDARTQVVMLRDQLQGMQQVVYNLNKKPFTVTPTDLSSVDTALTELAKADRDAVDAYRTGGSGPCALMAVEYAELKGDTPSTLSIIAGKMNKTAHRNFVQSAAARLTGIQRPDNGDDVQAISAQLLRTRQTLQQAIDYACPAGAKPSEKQVAAK